ncbi:hypothetical protein [Metaclostridioides mangenotii]|uniref:hypothetical protein n=1 Tax=Metaclostridioides mangenotii TaxID=1540 RepID=UPI0028EEDEBF|nr:hypothetical protein [Clostridioides mangenotii]
MLIPNIKVDQNKVNRIGNIVLNNLSFDEKNDCLILNYNETVDAGLTKEQALNAQIIFEN